MAWTAQSLSASSTEEQWFAVGNNVIRVFYDGSNSIKYAWSNNEGYSFGTAVTVSSTTGNNDVMLNCNIAYDAVSGRLHFLYGRNIDSGSSAVLCHRYTDNPFNASPTFSSEHVIDDGTGRGTNRFYRVALWANNSHVSLHYSTENNSTFTSDGLWRVLSSDGGATWGTPATVYTSTVVGAYEPNVTGFTDGTVVVSWYDDGSNTNQAGDIWIAKSRDSGATWDSAATKLTTTTNYGRPRISCDNGTFWIVANRPWNDGLNDADVYTLTSTDNAVTWGTPTKRGTHSTGDLDHPDIIVVNNVVGIVWADHASSPMTYGYVQSTDGGSTFGSVTAPMTTTGSSGAPRLVATTSHLLVKDFDGTASNLIWAWNPQFAVVPQDQTSVIDNFNGFTNGASINTGIWTASNFASGALKATGTAATRRSSAGTFDRAGSYINNATYTGNCEGWVTVTANGTGGEAAVFIWDPVAKSGYDFDGNCGDFGSAFSISKYTTGTASELTNLANALASSDKLCLQIIGNVLFCWRFRSSAWAELFRENDSTYRSSLKIELEIVGNTNAGPTCDDIGGGTLAVPSNSTAPAATGQVVVSSVLSCTGGTWTHTPWRYAYQWQSSSDGGSTWSSVSGATLPFMTVSDATKVYRCQVTASNAIGASSAANSNVLKPLTVAAINATSSMSVSMGGTKPVSPAAVNSTSAVTAGVAKKAAVKPASISASSTVTAGVVRTAAVKPASVNATSAVTAATRKLAAVAAAVTSTSTVTAGLAGKRAITVAAINATSNVSATVTVPGSFTFVGRFDSPNATAPVFSVTATAGQFDEPAATAGVFSVSPSAGQFDPPNLRTA